MKINIRLYSILALAVIFLMSACDDVNTMHDKYLQNGEDLLVGKVDSFELFGGNKRAKLVVWVGDYRASKIVMTRPDTSLTYTFTLNPQQRADSMVFYIDKLREGTNLLFWNTFSADEEIKSIPQNSSVTVWGDNYQSYLVRRNVASHRFNPLTKAFTVTWDAKNPIEPTFGKYAIGHELAYKTEAGNDTVLKDIYVVPANSVVPQATTVSTLKYFPKTGGSYSYRSLYIPDKLCIDTFYTAYANVVVE